MQQLPHIEVLDAQMVAILRTKTPTQKIAMISAAHRTARMLATAGARYLHPDWTEEQMQAEVLRRMTSAPIDEI